MTVQFLQGDCRDIMGTLQADSFDCIIADPPYGETSLVWDRWQDGWAKEALRIVKPTGSMWCFGSLRMFMRWKDAFEGWNFSHEIIWEKHNGSGLFNDRFRRVHEIVAHFYPSSSRWADIFKAPQFTNDATARTVRKKGHPAHWIGATGETVYKSEDGGPRLMRSVLQVRSEHGRAVHPTQKPVEIVEPILRYSCPIGGSVLDPFAGSGTVGIVAERCGIDATLIECNPEYQEMAQKRLRDDAGPLFAEPAE